MITEKESHLERDGKLTEYIWGSLLPAYDHTGEDMAIRQNLGHCGIPDFVAASTTRRRTGRSA